MVNRAGDWMRQAEHDLRHAERSRVDGAHGWARFAAHQAAEKAVKALYLHHTAEAWGHVIARLLAQSAEEFGIPDIMVEQGRVLDTSCIPIRSPDALPDGAPFECFGPLQSEEAFRHAGAIIEVVRAALASAA